MLIWYRRQRQRSRERDHKLAGFESSTDVVSESPSPHRWGQFTDVLYLSGRAVGEGGEQEWTGWDRGGGQQGEIRLNETLGDLIPQSGTPCPLSLSALFRKHGSVRLLSSSSFFMALVYKTHNFFTLSLPPCRQRQDRRLGTPGAWTSAG